MAKIIGNITATPNPRPDWLQTDSSKADYIKNKPTAATEINENSTNGEYAGAKAVYDLVKNFAENGTSVEYSTNPNIWELEKGWHYIQKGFYLGRDEGEYVTIEDSVLIYKTGDPVTVCQFYGIGCVYSEQINLIRGEVLEAATYCDITRFTEEIDSESPLNHNYPSEKAVVDFVKKQINSLIDTAPDKLNTLNELAEALGNDENFASAVMTQIGERVTKEDFDTFLSEIGRNDTYAISKSSYTTDWESILPAIVISTDEYDYIYKFSTNGRIMNYYMQKGDTYIRQGGSCELIYPYDTNFRGYGVINNSIYYLIVDNDQVAICCFDIETEDNYILRYTSMNFTSSTISAIDNCLYIFGGDIYNASGERENFTSVYKYDIETDEFTNTGIETTYNKEVVPVVVDDKIYTFGGSEAKYNSKVDGYDCIRIIDTTNNSFTELPMKSSLWSYYAPAVIDKKIYLFAGNQGVSSNLSYNTNIYVFNTIDNSMKQLDIYLPLKVAEPVTAVVDTVIYILGGISEDGATNHNQVFTLTKGEKTKLVKDVDSFSTHLEYPTAKAVYDFVSNKTDIPMVTDPIIGTLTDGIYKLKEGFYYGSSDDDYQRLDNYGSDNLLFVSGSKYFVFAENTRYYGTTYGYGVGGGGYYGTCKIERLVTEVNDDSNNEEYPSAKAVYDFVSDYVDKNRLCYTEGTGVVFEETGEFSSISDIHTLTADLDLVVGQTYEVEYTFEDGSTKIRQITATGLTDSSGIDNYEKIVILNDSDDANFFLYYNTDIVDESLVAVDNSVAYVLSGAKSVEIYTSEIVHKLDTKYLNTSNVISEQSTDDEIASAKAVFDFVNNNASKSQILSEDTNLTDLETGSYISQQEKSIRLYLTPDKFVFLDGCNIINQKGERLFGETSLGEISKGLIIGTILELDENDESTTYNGIIYYQISKNNNNDIILTEFAKIGNSDTEDVYKKEQISGEISLLDLDTGIYYADASVSPTTINITSDRQMTLGFGKIINYNLSTQVGETSIRMCNGLIFGFYTSEKDDDRQSIIYYSIMEQDGEVNVIQFTDLIEDFLTKEDFRNKLQTTISSSSTDNEIPTAKAVFDYFSTNAHKRQYINSSTYLYSLGTGIYEVSATEVLNKDYSNILASTTFKPIDIHITDYKIVEMVSGMILHHRGKVESGVNYDDVYSGLIIGKFGNTIGDTDKEINKVYYYSGYCQLGTPYLLSFIDLTNDFALAEDVVPNTRTINGKALSEDIVINYSDVGADQSGSATAALNEAKTYTDNLTAQKSQVQIIIWEADD